MAKEGGLSPQINNKRSGVGHRHYPTPGSCFNTKVGKISKLNQFLSIPEPKKTGNQVCRFDNNKP